MAAPVLILILFLPAIVELKKRTKTSFDESNNFGNKANFIWQVADDILRGTFKPHEYGDVILPFVVLRRLDCVSV